MLTRSGSCARLSKVTAQIPLGGGLLGRGIPIGNLTSQIFGNIYLNEFDQFVKHDLKVKNYARYTDDFLIIAETRGYLEELLPAIDSFLDKHLKLALHPAKVSVRPHHQGVDFLGYVVLPHHRVLRTKTKRRMFRKLKARVRQYKAGTSSEASLQGSLQSYLGVLSHADAYQLRQDLENQYWFWLGE